MLGYLEKQSEKRLFFGYLIRFCLTYEDLGESASRAILSEVFKNSQRVSKQFQKPISLVSKNIVGEAAWAAIYSLLGPTKLIEIDPEYSDIVDEIEMELLYAGYEGPLKFNVYQYVIQTLIEHERCHPEVLSLLRKSSQVTKLANPTLFFHPSIHL